MISYALYNSEAKMHNSSCTMLGYLGGNGLIQSCGGVSHLQSAEAASVRVGKAGRLNIDQGLPPHRIWGRYVAKTTKTTTPLPSLSRAKLWQTETIREGFRGCLSSQLITHLTWRSGREFALMPVQARTGNVQVQSMNTPSAHAWKGHRPLTTHGAKNAQSYMAENWSQTPHLNKWRSKYENMLRPMIVKTCWIRHYSRRTNALGVTHDCHCSLQKNQLCQVKVDAKIHVKNHCTRGKSAAINTYSIRK